ncbi:hypothetical protein LVD17_07525 [Fulvivirga ulvae]|uniref:hypothetical protein n=1 Tax=Fulvivirga ulvae TaxID=2904245 RepID=UPI001F24CB7A|nr:hypothetical protein [Fulvivirga ulvae]UII33667.1 hypothetical protein LVD17_07525 [Fulvivirga ulvae]
MEKMKNVTQEENAHIMSLDKVVQKLGNLSPPVPDKVKKEDSEKQREYLKNVIFAAKKNSSLFSQEEMGHVLAADYLLQATITYEQETMGDLKTEKAPPSTVLPRMAPPKADPRLAAALKVVTAIVKNSHSYQDALRAGVIAMQDCIPYVGGIVAAITTVLWPEKKESAWDQVKGQVNKVVEAAVFNHEYNIVQSQITAVQTSLNQYISSPSNREKGTILIATMVVINSLYERVNQSKYRHMLIGLMVPIGALHLTVLSERYNHYKVLFNQDDRTQALKELESTYNQYKVFFDSVYVEWKNWRSNALKVFYNSRHILWNKVYEYGVRDQLNVYNFGYSIKEKSRASDFKKWALNRAIADLADILSSTASYSSFFKGINITLNPILAELDTIVLGPYLWTRFRGTGNMRNTLISGWSRDKPSGEVKKINIYAYNSIDGLQFIYPNMNGTKVASGGGDSFTLDLKGKQCIGAKVNYSSGLAYRIQFLFADGSASPIYGNKGKWMPIAYADATVGRAYKLAYGNFAKGTGPSSTTGINGIIFTFKRV